MCCKPLRWGRHVKSTRNDDDELNTTFNDGWDQCYFSSTQEYRRDLVLAFILKLVPGTN